MEGAPENGKESSNTAHANGKNGLIKRLIDVYPSTTKQHFGAIKFLAFLFPY
jgi:hypothetical protein